MSDRFNLIEDNNVSPWFAISTVLDPRFKKVAFTNIELANKAIQSINNELAVSIGNDYLRTHWLLPTTYYFHIYANLNIIVPLGSYVRWLA
jgi:hypothetical protein